MDPSDRSELLRRRFKAIAPYAAPPPAPVKPRGQVRAKMPPERPKRQGVTWKTRRGRLLPVSLGIALYATWVKWLETQRPPKNSFKRLELSRKKRVSPLWRIAEKWPKRVARRETET
jgi:hypothetical protein